MKTKTIILSFLLVAFFSFAYTQTIELTFTGKSGSLNVPLDSIFIENLTQGGDTMLYYPDTVIELGTIGINEGLEKKEFMVMQNFPNPFNDQTYLDIYLPETGYIKLSVCNAIGKEVSLYENNLSKGIHSFTFSSGNEKLYFLTSIYESEVKTIKM
ncbi:MAG: T9SS type A sorting domain-containing protein, partial [Bacteroidales bacterium]|nr:T9SS type A sorting domain-containing protein [Bacteroidales bacterium]